MIWLRDPRRLGPARAIGTENNEGHRGSQEHPADNYAFRARTINLHTLDHTIQKIVGTSVPSFNAQKDHPANHIYHAFHHNFTTKAPCSKPTFLKNPQQKPRLPLSISSPKKLVSNATIETADAPPLPHAAPPHHPGRMRLPPGRLRNPH